MLPQTVSQTTQVRGQHSLVVIMPGCFNRVGESYLYFTVKGEGLGCGVPVVIFSRQVRKLIGTSGWITLDDVFNEVQN